MPARPDISTRSLHRFEKLLREGKTLKPGDGEHLLDVLRHWPYLNEAHLLYAAWQYHFAPKDFQHSLPASARHTGNPLRFRELIRERAPEEQKNETDARQETRLPREKAELKKAMQTEAGERSGSPTENENTPQQQNPDPDELIERFLRNKPRMEAKKDYTALPESDAEKSLVDEGGLVSETLARIHAGQGHYKKAIEIYNKLSLKFPGKSSYFAARIKDLQKKLHDS